MFDIGMALPTLAMKGPADDPEQVSGRAGSHVLPTQDAPAEGHLHHLLPPRSGYPFHSFETMRSLRGER